MNQKTHKIFTKMLFIIKYLGFHIKSEVNKMRGIEKET